MVLSTSSKGSESTEESSRTPIGWKPVALDGGYGWIIVLSSFLIHVFADGFVYSFGVIGQSLIDEFEGTTNKEVSTIVSLLTGLMYAIGPVAAILCNRFGCRMTTIIGAVIAVIGCGTSYYVTQLMHLYFTVGILMGAGFGMMYTPAIIIVTQYFELKRSLATGLTVCGSGVGTLVFSYLISFLIETVAVNNILLIFPIYGGILLLCVTCGLLFKPVSMQPIYEEDKKTDKEDVKTLGCWRKTIKKLGLSLLADPVYMLYVVSSVLATAGFNAAPNFIPMNAEAVLEQQKGRAASNLSAYGLANIFGRIFFGWICDRQLPFSWGKNRKLNRLWIFTATMILSGLSACFVFLFTNNVVYIIFCSFFGFVVSSYALLASVVLVDLIGVDRMTNGFGLLLVFHGVACISGPYIGGHLFDLTHRYDWTFVFLGSCLVVGGFVLPLTYLVQRMQHKEVDEQPLSKESLTSVMDTQEERKEQNA